jgi:glycerophosphoryl diester phosphodiesterase
MNHRYFDKQGHRGCRGLMPENTIPAMLHAIDLGVTTLEMDLVITKDRQILLSHEPYFNHEITTGPDGHYISQAEEQQLNIYQMSFAETQSYDVGVKPHPRFPLQKKIPVNKPLLADVIDRVEEYVIGKNIAPLFYNLEIKTKPETDDLYHPAPELFIQFVMEIVNATGIDERVNIQSFDFRNLHVMHHKYPTVQTAVLIEDFDKSSFKKIIDALGFLPSVYSPHFSLVSPELVKICHENKLRIIPWTVNDKELMIDLQKTGVDGLITDYPNLIFAT